MKESVFNALLERCKSLLVFMESGVISFNSFHDLDAKAEEIHKLREVIAMAEDEKVVRKEMKYTTKNGLIYRDGILVHLPMADDVAREHGFQYAEEFVRWLEERQKGEDNG